MLNIQFWGFCKHLETRSQKRNNVLRAHLHTGEPKSAKDLRETGAVNGNRGSEAIHWRTKSAAW
jgi:hypothetical protein